MDNIYTLHPDRYPSLLQEITDPPKSLYVRGSLPNDPDLKWLCVVGSRKYSTEGRSACEKLIRGLRNHPLVIVSGLALGMDGIAHQAALDVGLTTVAVPGSGLDWHVLHPKTNHAIARNILQSGGALLSEYEPDFQATPWSFPQRNRIMVGLSHAVLVIEAGERSGTLITARLASDYNRDLLVVPGPITAISARGSNRLLREGGRAVTSSEEILEELGINSRPTTDTLHLLKNLSEEEKKVVQLLHESLSRDDLIRELHMTTREANILLATMEIKGLISESLGKLTLR